MEIIYWTKKKKEIIDDILVHYEELETIKEEKELGFVPDGDGFEINMNDFSYEDYLENIEAYEVVSGKLQAITIEEDIEENNEIM